VRTVREGPVGTKRPQERLLERILGAVGAESPPEESKHLAAVLVIEALERGNRHDLHHLPPTQPDVDL
jgi:hypothetical protein